MTTYGVHLGAEPVSVSDYVHLWQTVDELGFEWISVWDHLLPNITPGKGSYDAVALHAALALSTSSATCGALVYSVTHRPVAVLANAIATIDRLSGGRAALGIGAGWSGEEHRMFGIPFGRAGQRLDMLEEALPCLRQLFDGEEVTFRGQHLQLEAARLVPGPIQDHLPIWVGGGGERRTMRLAALHADGWNSPSGLTPDEFAHKVAVLDAHCRDVGRNPRSIRRAANVLLAWDRDNLRDFARGGDFEAFTAQYERTALCGSDDEVSARIEQYAAAGADQVNFSCLPQWGVEGIERVARLLALTPRA